MESIGQFKILRKLSVDGPHAAHAAERYLVEDSTCPHRETRFLSLIRLSELSHPEIEQALDHVHDLRDLGEASPYFPVIDAIHRDEELLWWTEPVYEAVPLTSKMDICWSEEAIHGIVVGIVEALCQLDEKTECSHGNLSGASIYLHQNLEPGQGKGTLLYGRFTPVLTNFSFDETTQGQSGHISDLRALGRIIIGLVTGECCDNMEIQFPLHPHPGWERLGRKEHFWKQLASWLAYPALSLNQLNIHKIKDDLKPTHKKREPIKIFGWVAAILVISILVPLYAEKHFFGVSASDFESPSDSELAMSLKMELDEAGRGMGLGSGGSGLDSINLNDSVDFGPQSQSPGKSIPRRDRVPGQVNNPGESETIIEPDAGEPSPTQSSLLYTSGDSAELIPRKDLPEQVTPEESVSPEPVQDTEVVEPSPESVASEKLIPPAIETIPEGKGSASNEGVVASNTVPDEEVIGSGETLTSEVKPQSAPSLSDGNKWTLSNGARFVYIEKLPGITIRLADRKFSSPVTPVRGLTRNSMALDPMEARSIITRDTRRQQQIADRSQSQIQTIESKPGGFMQIVEISQRLFTEVMGDNPSIGSGPDTPVNSVSWSEAEEFCYRWTTIEKAKGFLPDGWVITLPSKSQYDLLCQVPSTSGKDFLKSRARDLAAAEALSLSGRRSGPEPVTFGTALNGFGVKGLYGNLSEWCYDEQNQKVVTIGWNYDFSGNTAKNPFVRVPLRDRSYRQVGFRCVIIQE